MYEVAPKIFNGGLRFDLVGELLQSVDVYDGFMTGSAAIGAFRDDSDIDVAFPIYSEPVDELKKKSSELGFRKVESAYNRGYKLEKFGSVTLNVITLHPYDYCAWLFATNILKEQRMIPDRLIRHRAFELAITLFKLSNSNADYLTISGASTYYKKNHKNSLTSEFEAFVTRLIDTKASL